MLSSVRLGVGIRNESKDRVEGKWILRGNAVGEGGCVGDVGRQRWEEERRRWRRSDVVEANGLEARDRREV